MEYLLYILVFVVGFIFFSNYFRKARIKKETRLIIISVCELALRKKEKMSPIELIHVSYKIKLVDVALNNNVFNENHKEMLVQTRKELENL